MTDTDIFWEILNKQAVRGISLHGWQKKKIDFAKNLHLITSIVDQLELWPVRVEIYHEGKKRAKVSRWKSKEDASLEGFEAVEALSIISALRPAPKAMNTKLRSIHLDHRNYDPRRYWIYFEGAPEALTLELGLRIVKQLLQLVTPSYGFSEIEASARCYWFHTGQPTSGMSDIQHDRAAAHEQVRPLDPEDRHSLANRLLDVYALNILNARHLESMISGKPLADWITAGENGTLQQLKPGVHAWLVPDDIRPKVREKLLLAGCLLVKA